MFMKNMKKALALLASLLILCTLIPVGALLNANADSDNLVVNGDFETGDLTGWENLYGGCTISFAEGHNSSKAVSISCGQWQMVRQKISVEANADYVVTAYSKGATNMTLLIKDGNDSSNLAQDSFKGGSDWSQISISFNSGSNTSIYLSLMGNNPGATGTFDDVVLTKVGGGSGGGSGEEPEATPILDIDFEDGVAKFDKGSVVTEGDNKCLKWSATGGWSSTYVVAGGVEKNADYVITFKMKTSVQKDVFVTIQDADWGSHYNETISVSNTGWTEYTVNTNVKNCVSGSGKIMFKFQDTGDAMDIWVDDILMVKKAGSEPDEPDEPDEPVSGNLVVNGDFETGNLNGWESWQSTKVDADAARNGSYGAHLIGNGSWNGLLNQTIPATAGKSYEITVWLKVVKNGVNIQIKDGNSGAAMLDKATIYAVDATKWTKKTFTVTPTGNAIFLNFSGIGGSADADAGKAEEAYLDDITACEVTDTPDEPDNPDEPDEPDNPIGPASGIVNGNFETGDGTGWGIEQSTTVSGDAAHSGSYGAHLKGNGSWNTLLERTFDVTAGKNYELSFWIKANASGTNIKFLDQNWEGAAVAEGMWFNSTTWTQKTVIFTAASGKFYLQFCGSGEAAEDLYVDDVTLVEIKEASFDGYITNGNFETGKTDGWENLYNNNKVTMVKGYDSDNAVKIEAGEWTQFRQKVKVEADTDYVIWVMHKSSSKMTLLIKDGADTTNMAQTALASGANWTLTTIEFNSGANTEIYLGVMGNEAGAGGTYDNFQMFKKGEEPEEPDIPDGPDVPVYGEFKNGDFEKGDEGWTLNDKTASIVTTDVHGGKKALKLDNPSAWSEAALQTFDAAKNTNYIITWYAKRVSGTNPFNLILMNDSDVNYSCDGQNWMNETSGDWTKYEVVINTGNNKAIKVKFTSEKDNSGVILIDDITVTKEGDEPGPTDGNLIKNGSFENGKDDWNWFGKTELSKDAFIGDASAKLDFDKAYGEALTQVVKIEPNTDYVLIWHTRRVSGNGAWDLFLMDYDTINKTNENIDPTEGQKWFSQTDKEWTESRLTFNSGKTTKLFIKFGPEADDAGVFMLDEVAMYVKGTEPTDPVVPPTPPKTSMYMTSYGVVNNRPINPDNNLLYNASFENAKGGQWQEGFTGKTVSVVEDKTTKFGSKSLYFNTSGKEEQTKLVFWLELEADTSYVFSTWLKGKYLSDSNIGDATIGVVDDSGAYLEMDGYAILNGERQIVPTAWDNDWHLRSIEFNTGSNTKVGIAISGIDSQMYIDDMALFAVGQGTKYMSENMKGSINLSYSIDHYACEDEDSLIPDPNFNTKDKSGFWADSYGWRNGVLSFADNKYEYGTSMKYTASDSRAALSTIKWIEVEKDTQYVFVVDLKILEDGFGKLVLFDDKLKDKLNFLEISFDSYDYNEENSRDGWYTIGSSFNTGVYDRIGIAIVDDGGQVLLDNMRLFKETDGADVNDKFIPLPTTTTTTEPTTEAPVEIPTDPYYPLEEPTETEPVTVPTEVTTTTVAPTEAPTEPTQPVDEGNDVFSTVMLWVGIGAGTAAVLAGGGVGAMVLIKKRKKAGVTPEE